MEKVYLILGASSDIGGGLIREIAKHKSHESIKIIAHYCHSQSYIQSLIEECKDIDIIPLQADLSNLEATKDMVKRITELGLEPSHIVSLTANQFAYTRLNEWDSDIINKDMTIQVYSFAEILKAFVPNMLKKEYGKIVVMLTSYTIGVPPKNMAGYVTVKYALLGLMKSIASDFGDRGININGISPAMIDTKFLNNIGRKIKEFTAESSPKHRNLSVDDVVPMMCMLLSEDANFINGSNINLSTHSE